jgi:malate dehydrogenase (oxaloacetate-decarboxylating)
MPSKSSRSNHEPRTASKKITPKSKIRRSSSTKTASVSKLALKYSRHYEGKIQTIPKVPITSLNDFSIWYTPGVAAVSLAVAKNTDLSFEYTNRWNNLCILTDGSRVLGLGDIGPEGSLPVMEGKSLIYKVLGGVDAIPLPISAHETKQIMELATYIQPAFGAIHLEDISSPKCFEILDSLREKLTIPVWHDDQQGTAGVTLAALLNSLILTDRKLDNSKIVLFGAGAANIAAARLMVAAGIPSGNLIVVDSKGILYPEREDMDHMMLSNKWKYDLALSTNAEKLWGDVDVAAEGADVLIAASTPGPNVLASSTLRKMNKNAILFALSNPIPEIWPDAAKKAGIRIIATGRSDFPNQVNNSLLFPSIIRGVLDVRSKSIPDDVIVVAAQELANYTRDEGTLSDNHILPTMMDREIYPLVASAVGEKCVNMGIARKSLRRSQIEQRARRIIEQSRKIISSLQERHLIEPLPKGKRSGNNEK